MYESRISGGETSMQTQCLLNSDFQPYTVLASVKDSWIVSNTIT